MQLRSVEGGALQRIGSAGYLIGALLLVVASLLLPRASDLSNVQAMQRTFAAQAVLLQACALLYAFGYWAVLIGTVGVSRAITAAGAAWADLGRSFALVATALWTLGFALDVAYAAALATWLAAAPAGKPAAYSIVVVLSPLGFGRGLFPLTVIVNGLAFTFLGVGMVQSTVYPRWGGSGGLLLGAAGVLLGIVQTFTGRERALTPFIVLEALTILWLVGVGGWLAWNTRSSRRGAGRTDRKDSAPNQGLEVTTTRTTG